jgi:hypothetical protein
MHSIFEKDPEIGQAIRLQGEFNGAKMVVDGHFDLITGDDNPDVYGIFCDGKHDNPLHTHLRVNYNVFTHWEPTVDNPDGTTDAEVGIITVNGDCDREALEFNYSLTNVTPGDNQIHNIALVREKAKELGKLIIQGCPNGRCKSTAKTNLEEVVMWAVKGIVLDWKE